MLVAERQNPLILDGIPVHPPERQRAGVAVPPAPPPSDVLEGEPLLPLTQPLPREEVDPYRAVEETTEPRSEAVWSNEVD